MVRSSMIARVPDGLPLAASMDDTEVPPCSLFQPYCVHHTSVLAGFQPGSFRSLRGLRINALLNYLFLKIVGGGTALGAFRLGSR
jgi:hypothetical protein